MSVEPNSPHSDEASAPTRPVVAPVTSEPSSGQPPAGAVRTAQPTHKSIVREYAEAIIIAMLLAFAIRVFVVQAFKIPSGSMIPTLLVGDHILVSKLSYGLQWPADCQIKPGFPPITCYSSRTVIPFGTIQRGDIIVFRFPEDEDKDFIKRVIGLPGDTIQIRNKIVHVNGTPFEDHTFTQREIAERDLTRVELLQQRIDEHRAGDGEVGAARVQSRQLQPFRQIDSGHFFAQPVNALGRNA